MLIGPYLDAIRAISLFSCFDADELRRLFDSSGYDLRKYEKGQILHLQNEICQNIDIILHGKLSVQKIDGNGNVLTICVFADTDSIGANLLFATRNNYPMTVMAVRDSVVLHMHRDLVLALCRQSSCFTAALLTAISDRTLLLTEKIDALTLKTIRQSVVDFLKYEYHLRQTPVIVLDFSKKDMAERLGIQRTSLSRELQKMKRYGIIEYDSGTITIKRMDIVS